MDRIKIPSDSITKFKFDPALHDFLFDGALLRTGMRVFLEDEIFSKDYAFSEREIDGMKETQRWCTVGRVELSSNPVYDESGYAVVDSNTLVSFEAIYDDGHVCKRRCNTSFGLYVEKPVGEYAQIVRDGVRKAFPDLRVV